MYLNVLGMMSFATRHMNLYTLSNKHHENWVVKIGM